MAGRSGHDPRMALVGAAGWLGGIAAHGLGAAGAAWSTGALAVAAVVVGRTGPARVARVLAACALVAAGVGAATLLRSEVVAHGPLRDLAEQRAVAHLAGTVVADPRPVAGRWGDRVAVRLRVEEVAARGSRFRLGGVVVVIGDENWAGVALGAQVSTTGRLVPDDGGVSALVVGARPPVRIRGPDLWWRAAAAVRSSIRASVADRPTAQRELVPALVVGDDAGLPEALEEDFRSTGLTHLTAVSGTNLTLVVGFVLLLARGLGVRGRWLTLVGLAGIAGFVVLARTEPSVVRAAAMGTVGLFALGTDGRRRGLRALGVAVTGLLLVSPGLAVAPGFALSVLATAGIVLLGPPVQEALSRWLPAPVAAAVTVPFAAQLACTPVIAALSGEVSLVAVLANLLVAPVVGPATVLGLVAGLVGLLSGACGRVLGTLAGACVSWIVQVAERGADLPVPAVPWGAGAVPVAVLTVVCAAVAVVAPRVLRSRRVGTAVAVASLLLVLGVPGTIPVPGWRGGWPPSGWVLAACDVGQGDALAVAVAPRTAIVVDAGPDPAAVDRCLERLGVDVVPLVVLTHFHADHVAGLPGVLQDRTVGAVEASPMLDPAAGARQVAATAERVAVPVRAAPYDVTRRYGDVTVQVVAPDLPQPVAGPGDGSAANDASVVLLVESRGLRILLTGDVEPPAQARLASRLAGLEVDVLKVPHHGSSHQDVDWLRSLGAAVAVVSVGDDNDYGHPDHGVLDTLAAGGAEVARTDTGGDLVVLAGEDGPVVVTAD